MFFFFNDTATTEIYTLSLHDALPISRHGGLAAAALAHEREGRALGDGEVDAVHGAEDAARLAREEALQRRAGEDRKSTRLNSSHANISYAVFCLKKKNTQTIKILKTT